MLFWIISDFILLSMLAIGIFIFLPYKIYKSQTDLLSLLEHIKDFYTENHSSHVGHLCGVIYKHLPREMKRDVNKKMLIRAGHLHDIGKLFISSEILNKPDKLTDDEFESVKAHPNSGAMILNGTSHKSISQIVALHHERVDGKGYYGVRRHDIPIESKIIAVADTFSALTTNRCYRQGFSVDDALDEIKRCSGTQFDERIVKCFLNIDISELRAASTTIKKYRAGV